MEPTFTAQPSGDNAAPVKDATSATFGADVIEASNEVPVIVDFWAPWCGPCKQIGPVLEKVTREARGALRLVKINIDENQELTEQMRVQSIPAVYAFFQGRPVDSFIGAQPESQIKAFAARLKALGGAGTKPDLLTETLDRARHALEENDTAAAAELYSGILASEPECADASAGLVRCYVATGDYLRGRRILDQLPAEVADRPPLAAARSALELAEQAPHGGGEIPELVAKTRHDPEDHQARFDLASALFASGEREAAINELLEIVGRDKEWNGQAARKQLLKFFEALGHTHPLSEAGRRRLSALLFA